MTGTARRLVLAGVDGSTSSLPAVRWAAREAARRGVPLSLLHRCFVPSLTPYLPVGLPRSGAVGVVADLGSEAS
jgi:nucleotide-binding universal stress UspA family protein